MTFVADRPTDRFDRVIMLDVIEHVDEDVDFVHGIVNDLLAEDAVVLVSVPAYPALFSSHDRKLRHSRRYSPGEGRGLLQGSGLSVIAEGGLFHSLLPLRVGQVLLERVRPPKSPSDGIGNWASRRGDDKSDHARADHRRKTVAGAQSAWAFSAGAQLLGSLQHNLTDTWCAAIPLRSLTCR
jgi:hypothetical protein